ncbi:DUF4192 domain-containing protein [Terracoccus luteus]|uniref:DUF4192 family protein n=1 Tax=Terracoccus luteus TaxID=53356 RepID=A0A839PUC6_9MICO|nr:DUF4192 domain-containing protein [Terracoccus luteus]MBB2987117.1 hypothetical protein [Terracoccus luteus]MCP2172768.1 hypothetical protein [Terracoccus luteus]
MSTVSVSGPAQLLAVIPYHLGFQPLRSVVVVALRGTQVDLVARVDIPAPGAREAVVSHLMGPVQRESPTTIALIGYESDVGESMGLLDAFAVAVSRAGLHRLGTFVVRGDRWFGVGCDCCPAEGRPMLRDADVPAIATYVGTGHAVLSGREALGTALTPLAPGDPGHDAVALAVDDWRGRWERAARLHLWEEREAVWLGDGDVDDEPAFFDEPALCDELTPFDGLGPDDEMPPWPDGPVGTSSDGGARSARDELLDESLCAWGALLRGELGGSELAARLPAIVGPLRDAAVRDALVVTTCPGGPMTPDCVDERLLERVEHHLPPAVGRDEGGRTGESTELAELAGLAELGLLGGPGGPGGPRAAWSPVPPHAMLASLEAAVRATPEAHAAPLLSVYASVAWWSGDGARATVAVEHALRVEPDHPLCTLLARALDLGMRPRARSA